MTDFKIDNEDALKLLNMYKSENANLKAQITALRNENEALRREFINFKNQIYDNQQKEDTISRSKQKSDEAWELFLKNDFDGAIKLCNKALELNPNNFFAYNNRGLAYSSLKQYERAIQDYDKAIQLNPNDDYAHNNRGWAYYCLKQHKKAIKDFEKALELNPNYEFAKNNFEACYEALCR